MKKFFIILLSFFVVVFLVLTTLMLVLGKHYHFEKSILIQSPKETVWSHVSSARAINQWNPWLKLDPKLKLSYYGTSGQVGDGYRWDSKVKAAGKGRQVITSLQPYSAVHTNLGFVMEDGHESVAQANIILQSQGQQTKVTWTMDNDFDYPMNLMKLMMDHYMEKPYTEGLAKLKQLSESPVKP